MIKSYFFRVTCLLLVATLAMAGCAAQAATQSAVTTGYGEVTEVTLTTTIEASGTIEPRQVASLNWTTSGMIASVNVKLGQKVEAGDILLSLDPNSVPNNLKITQLNLAEMTSPLAIATAEQAVITAQDTVEDAEKDRASLDYHNAGAIESAYASYILAEQKYQSAKTLFDARTAHLSNTDPDYAIAYQQLYNAQLARDKALLTYNAYSGSASAKEYSDAEAALSLARARLQESEYYLAALRGEELPVDATGSSLLKLIELRMSVDALNLRAPFDGTVSAIYDEVGMVVGNNETSLKLIDRSKLYVTISLTEEDIVKIAEGDKAGVVVDILPDLALSGHVYAIEPMGTVSNGVVYYEVQIELDQADDQIPLSATATVTIQIGEPVLSLAVPATAIQNDSDGNEYIQVVSGGTSKTVQVVSGTILDDDRVIISGEVALGDQVLLVIQTTTESEQIGGFMMGIGGGGGRDIPAGGDVPRDGGAPDNVMP